MPATWRFAFPHWLQLIHKILLANDVDPSPQLMMAVSPGSTVPASAKEVLLSKKNALAVSVVPSMPKPSPPPPRSVGLVAEMSASLILALSGSALFEVWVASGSVTVTLIEKSPESL